MSRQESGMRSEVQLMNNIKLETERLILRPFIENDFAQVHAYASKLENVSYMLWGPNDEDDTRNFIAETIQKAEANPRKHYDFAIILKESEQAIGGCGIYLNDEMNQGMLGWILNMNHWKRGYGKEVAAALLKFGFEELKLHRIWATCHIDNYGSYRVMEYNGMRREAHFVKARFGRVCDKKQWYDEYHYGILREEYLK